MVEQRILEESRRAAGAVVTGWAALRLHGAGYFDGLAADGTSERPVDLAITPPSTLRPAPGIRIVREQVPDAEICRVKQVLATSPVRAAFDEARRAPGLRDAVVALDMALSARVVYMAGMQAYLPTRAGSRGLRQARAALDLAEDRSMSPKETALRLIWCLDAQLPRPKLNWPVADASGTFIGRPDLLSPELAVIGEFDGAAHRSRERHRDDLRRDDRFRSVGLEPFRIVGADLGDVPLVLHRIEQAISRAQDSSAPRTWRLRANPRPVA